MNDQKVLDRFNKNYIPEPNSGCWIWLGQPHCDFGYGRFGINKKMYQDHRASWYIFKGDIGNLCVLHSCDNTFCVNPDHLFLGTQSDNNKDQMKKGRTNGGPKGVPKSDEHKKNIAKGRRGKKFPRKPKI